MEDPSTAIPMLPGTKRIGHIKEPRPAGEEEPNVNYVTDMDRSLPGTGIVTAKTQQEQRKKKKKKKKEEKGEGMPRFRLNLLPDEIQSDLMKMNNGKRIKNRRRKKDRFNDLFPGGCLPMINEKSYETFADRF